MPPRHAGAVRQRDVTAFCAPPARRSVRGNVNQSAALARGDADGEDTSGSQGPARGRRAHPPCTDARRQTMGGARRWPETGVRLAPIAPGA